MKVKDLKPHPKNPRKISVTQLENLRLSLAEFGDCSGVVFNRKTGTTDGGHQRVKTFNSDDEIVIVNEYNPPTKTGTVREGFIVHNGEKYTYREVDWPPEKETAAMIAANKHGGEWDLPLLKEAANLIPDFDHRLLGFEIEEWVAIKASDFDPSDIEGLGSIDDVDEKTNFIIACENLADLEKMKLFFDCSGSKIFYKTAAKILNIE